MPSRGDPVAFAGRPVSAEYFHADRLLTVREGAEGDERSHYFVEPVRWYTAPSADK